MKEFQKRIGFGTISLLLYIMGFLFVVSFSGKTCYGDILLRDFGLIPWSNGNTGIHYTIFYSLLFFVPSFILGYQHKNHIGATIGKVLSFIMIILFLIMFPLFSVCLPS